MLDTDLVLTVELTELPALRSLVQAAKCALIKPVGRRGLLDTFIRVFTAAPA